jgi:predicted RNase H-like nuclease (RuvC/YqgF family)
MNKKDSSYLAAFEALGMTIEELKREISSKNFRISELEKELAKAKGGRNEW